MERRFLSNQQFRAIYIQFMRTYEELGYMSKFQPYLVDKQVVYLPHHGVINEGSSTTKVRVVFDGSSKTSTGYSLNEIKLADTTLQEELLNIVIRFRQHTYIVCADIQKMYRQIQVDLDQRSLQCILWREGNTKKWNPLN